MSNLFEHLFAYGWNRLASPRRSKPSGARPLDLGRTVLDGVVQQSRASLPEEERCEHCAILGITGKGKSYCLRHCTQQDIERRRGFLYIDFHGDTKTYLLRVIAAEEQRTGTDLSERLIVIEPGDPDYSIGLNVLESPVSGESDAQRYVQISEVTQILKSRWNLDFGARTEELLRNALHVLADNHLTLLELAPLLANPDFRARCLNAVQNPEVLQYFRERFDSRSEAMQFTLSDAILNKISGFTTDPRFRHILGQQKSTFSLLEAMDRGYWVILNLDKGRLGPDAATLGSLLLAKVKNALFARKSRRLFTIYADELQNLVAYDTGLDTLFSEARKFGISVFSANQYADQYPPQMRAAVMAVGAHIYFQLSSTDADKVAAGLDGGRRLAETLKNLPKRQFVYKHGSNRPQQVMVPNVEEPQVDFTDLYRRCIVRWAQPRTQIESQIRQRQMLPETSEKGGLNGWD